MVILVVTASCGIGDGEYCEYFGDREAWCVVLVNNVIVMVTEVCGTNGGE